MSVSAGIRSTAALPITIQILFRRRPDRRRAAADAVGGGRNAGRCARRRRRVARDSRGPGRAGRLEPADRVRVGGQDLRQPGRPAGGAWHASSRTVTLFLAVFTVGVATDAAGASRLLGGRVSARAAPWAAAMHRGERADRGDRGGAVCAGGRRWGVLGSALGYPANGERRRNPLGRDRGEQYRQCRVPSRRHAARPLLACSAVAAGLQIALALDASRASAVLLIPLLWRL